VQEDRDRALCSHHIHCHIFRGTILCTPSTDSIVFCIRVEKFPLNRSLFFFFACSFLSLVFSVSTFVPLPDLFRKRSLVEFLYRDRRRASAFDQCLKKALSPGHKDLLTSNERFVFRSCSVRIWAGHRLPWLKVFITSGCSRENKIF
jgi:hypothetical protein